MKILMAIWVDASWHPVVVSSAQLFSERGDRVVLLSRKPDPKQTIGTADFGARSTVYSIGTDFRRWQNQLSYIKFLIKAIIYTLQYKPDVIIGYDTHGLLAAYLAKLVHRKSFLIYHNLDLADSRLLRFFGRMVKSFEGFIARRADVAIFSSAGRAELFVSEVPLKHKPLIVKNCQRTEEEAHDRGALHRLLQEQGISFEKLVVRLGSMGPNHGIEATIRSVPEWEGNWALLLGGVPIDGYLETLSALIASLGLQDRVVILTNLPYSLWYDCLYSSHAGIALYEHGNINHAYMAGAGNKLNLYLKAGVPSIVPNIPDFVDFVDKYDAGVVAEATDPASIAHAVNSIFADQERYALLCQNARHAFNAEYNFEKQFAPVLQAIQSLTSRHG